MRPTPTLGSGLSPVRAMLDNGRRLVRDFVTPVAIMRPITP